MIEALFSAAVRTGYETPDEMRARLEHVALDAVASFPGAVDEREAILMLARHQADRLAAAKRRVSDLLGVF